MKEVVKSITESIKKTFEFNFLSRLRKSEKCDKFEIESEHDIGNVGEKWKINMRWEQNHWWQAIPLLILVSNVIHIPSFIIKSTFRVGWGIAFIFRMVGEKINFRVSFELAFRVGFFIGNKRINLLNVISFWKFTLAVLNWMKWFI